MALTMPITKVFSKNTELVIRGLLGIIVLSFLFSPNLAQAHDIVCKHKHIHAFRVVCDPEFAVCTKGKKEGRCITRKTSGLINTWDCECITSDAMSKPTKAEMELLKRLK